MKLKYFPKSIISSSLVLNFVGGMSGIDSYSMKEKMEDKDYRSSADPIYDDVFKDNGLKYDDIFKYYDIYYLNAVVKSLKNETIYKLKKKNPGEYLKYRKCIENKYLIENLKENNLSEYEHLFNLDYVEDLDAEFDYDCKNFSEMEMKLINIEKFLSEKILKSRKKLSLKNNLNTKMEIIMYYKMREKIRNSMEEVFKKPLKKIFKNPQNEQKLLDDQIDDQNVDMRDASKSSSCLVF